MKNAGEIRRAIESKVVTYGWWRVCEDIEEMLIEWEKDIWEDQRRKDREEIKVLKSALSRARYTHKNRLIKQIKLAVLDEISKCDRGKEYGWLDPVDVKSAVERVRIEKEEMKDEVEVE